MMKLNCFGQVLMLHLKILKYSVKIPLYKYLKYPQILGKKLQNT